MITLDISRLYGFKLVHSQQGQDFTPSSQAQAGLVLATPLAGKIGEKLGVTSEGNGEIPTLLGGKIGQKGPPPIVHPE